MNAHKRGLDNRKDTRRDQRGEEGQNCSDSVTHTGLLLTNGINQDEHPETVRTGTVRGDDADDGDARGAHGQRCSPLWFPGGLCRMRVWVSAHRDVGAFAEDRCGAQHHGHDHQLDVPDSAITGRAQHHQADRGAGRLSGPEYRSKCRVIFLSNENSNEKFRYLAINPTCEEKQKNPFAHTAARINSAFFVDI